MEISKELAQTILLWLIVIWFIVINLFIFIPSYNLLSTYKPTAQKGTIINPPTPPNAFIIPDLDSTLSAEAQKSQAKIIDQKLLLYTQQVSAYSQQINAYKTYSEVKKTNNDFFAYETVVKDSLWGLLNTVLMAFLGFVGIKTTALLFTNYFASKAGEPVKDFKLF